jgi:hypothetical protein
MPDLRLTVLAQMRALIQRFGCLDAAAATIQARTGGECSKGVLSRRMAGQLDWPVADVAALEDAMGLYPVTEMLARRMNGDARGAGLPLVAQAGIVAKEAGEAVSAALAAATACRGGDYATALVEIDEAEVAIRALRLAIEAQGAEVAQPLFGRGRA